MDMRCANSSGSSGTTGGLLLATGHYRNGILMSPVTADAIVACLTGRRPAAEWEPFLTMLPRMFDKAAAATIGVS